MLKNISKLECKVNERTFQFLCDGESLVGEVKEALFQFLKFVGEIEDKAKAAQEQKELENDKVHPIDSPEELKPE